jgi:hypothetical protein
MLRKQLPCRGHKGMKPEYKYLMRTTYRVALLRCMLILVKTSLLGVFREIFSKIQL